MSPVPYLSTSKKHESKTLKKLSKWLYTEALAEAHVLSKLDDGHALKLVRAIPDAQRMTRPETTMCKFLLFGLEIGPINDNVVGSTTPVPDAEEAEELAHAQRLAILENMQARNQRERQVQTVRDFYNNKASGRKPVVPSRSLLGENPLKDAQLKEKYKKEKEYYDIHKLQSIRERNAAMAEKIKKMHDLYGGGVMAERWGETWRKDVDDNSDTF